MEKDKKQKDDWVRLASKSRPGRFYLFNKATGETKWLPVKTDDEAKQKQDVTPPKLSVSKTPAQDRLKRLQHSLKLSQAKSKSSNTKTKEVKDEKNKLKDHPTTRTSANALSNPSNMKIKKLKKEANNLKGQPTTSSSASKISKSPKKVMKRTHSESSPNQKHDSVKYAKYSLENVPKILAAPDSSTDSCSTNISVEFKNCREEPCTSKKAVFDENLQNIETNTSKLTNIVSSVGRKIKDIFRIPFNMPKKNGDDQFLSNYNNFSGIINTAKFKTDKPDTNKNRISSAKEKAIVKQIREESEKSPESKIFINSHKQFTAKNQNILSYPRGSANSRLERLKQSLISQQQSCNGKDSSGSSNVIEANNSTSLQQGDLEYNKSINSSDAANNNDEVEAMDWQPIIKDEDDPTDITSLKSIVGVEKSKKFLLKEVNIDENQTIGDIIDTVNENLLRFSAQNQKDTTKNMKWRKDFYYFIVDTNVLLKDLTFIEDLSKMKLCDTKGSMIYIPYSVLQELDKLKMRSGSQEGVKTLAVRAIKYLNSKLLSSLSHLQAQSAIEERRYLIDVNSADDSIINCCLQVKEQIPNLIFLTEDVNLRNKAICNNILVSTKSDLVVKRYDCSVLS